MGELLVDAGQLPPVIFYLQKNQIKPLLSASIINFSYTMAAKLSVSIRQIDMNQPLFAVNHSTATSPPAFLQLHKIYTHINDRFKITVFCENAKASNPL